MRMEITCVVGLVGIGCTRLQYLKQEVDVPCRQLESLDFAQFIARQGGNDVPEGGERFVQGLRSLTFTHVRHRSLGLHFLVSRTTFPAHLYLGRRRRHALTLRLAVAVILIAVVTAAVTVVSSFFPDTRLVTAISRFVTLRRRR